MAPRWVTLEPVASSWLTVGGSMPETLHASIALEALDMAIRRQRPVPALLLHSDSKSVMTGVPGRSDPHSDGPCSVAGVAWRPFAACPTL